MRLTQPGESLHFPGTCLLCGTAGVPNDPLIDQESEFETLDGFVYRRYICAGCTRQAAQLLGLQDKNDASRLKGTVARLEKQRGEAVQFANGIIDLLT